MDDLWGPLREAKKRRANPPPLPLGRGPTQPQRKNEWKKVAEIIKENKGWIEGDELLSLMAVKSITEHPAIKR